MERIDIVQAVADNFPQATAQVALNFATKIDRGYANKIADTRYKLEDEKYNFGAKEYDRGYNAGKDSVRTTFEPKIVEATVWATTNFTPRDYERKIQCIIVLRTKFAPLGLLEAKTIIEMITPKGTTDALDWAKLDEAEGRVKKSPTPNDMPQKIGSDSNSSSDGRSESYAKCGCGCED
ncbi:hypothetical protein SEA_TOMAS_276 [Streptomyces phage Tomas]|uniref:Uncharacterized protein n=1 Tax=Streptomyces phage Tomas TaxID=2914443 RepID=A0AA49BV33_9CAUD|nr:hypothetical protein PP453_gp020 [Streptomyces phage Tomas]YP_010651358.1 hypothetical protein PP453_gp048 [Streptomyces phage Tomas]UMO76211.1 hypothetical protein SEA_TOMAS_20 [Streptomyces phage Tomas]UMO76419.1 hypothetical protein SEA_TOMAS_276 [Streptomyces phage Tomas]